MELRIFTLPFDEVSESFPDEIVTEFCLNKKVHQVDAKFFVRDGEPFWSVAVQYEIVVKGEDKIRELDEEQRLLFEKLRAWRKEQAFKEGIPVYLVATNAQFLQMVKLRCRTMDCFKNVKGYGRKRIGKYGKPITELIKGFYESRKEAAKEGIEPDAKGDFPF